MFVNGRNLGRKAMEENGHLEWKVPYEKGSIKAIAYSRGQKILSEERVTADYPSAVNLTSNKEVLSGKNKPVILEIKIVRIDVRSTHSIGNDLSVKFGQ